MTRRISACLAALTLTFVIAGCGGGGSNSAAGPTPPGSGPTPSPGPTSSPSSAPTFVYAATSAGQTVGYRLNADGTLTSLSGSPFAVKGGLAAAGKFLAAVSGNTVATYSVDASSGALAQAGSDSVVQGGPIAADANTVYVAGSIPSNNSTGIYGFAIGANGALTPLAGSPYVFTGACDLCDVPFALTLNNDFLVQGGTGFHGVGDFTVYARGAGGVLGPAEILGTDAQESVAIQPSGRFAYGLDTSDFLLSQYSVASGAKPTEVSAQNVDNAQDIIVDPTGKFLLLLDQTGSVHVFTIDAATGSASQVGTSESAGADSTAISTDPSGHFVFVSADANPNSPGAVSQITVFSFDPASGAMKKVQTSPLSAAPGRVVVITP